MTRCIGLSLLLLAACGGGAAVSSPSESEPSVHEDTATRPGSSTTASDSDPDDGASTTATRPGPKMSTGVMGETAPGTDSGADSSSDSTGPWSSSGASSSSSGESYATCYTEAWSVALAEQSYLHALAVDPKGLIFVAGNSIADDGTWVAAWTQDGTEVWSKFIDASAFGYSDAPGDVVDLDVLPDGDLLLSYDYRGDERVAVFADLDAVTGKVVSMASLEPSELAALAPPDGYIYRVSALGTAVAPSGRVFVLGAATNIDGGRHIFLGELDEDSDLLMWVEEIAYEFWSWFWHSFFVADDVHLYLGCGMDYPGPCSYGGQGRLSLTGEWLDGLGPRTRSRRRWRSDRMGPWACRPSPPLTRVATTYPPLALSGPCFSSGVRQRTFSSQEGPRTRPS